MDSQSMQELKTPAPSISRRAAAMPFSSIRRVFQAVQELEDQGIQVIPLHIGDPDFELPKRIGAAISTALAEGRTHYSSMPGIWPLREAIARHVSTKFGIDCDARRIICSHGATQALNACLHLTCDAETNILMPEVYFPNCLQQAMLSNVHPRFYPLDDTYRPRLETLGSMVDDHTRAILVNSPSNPTGAVFPPDTMQALHEFARGRGLWLISDEAYIDYVYEGQYISPLQFDWQLPENERCVLTVFSFSKSYAATGLRVGWTVAPREAEAVKLGLINEPLTGSLTTPLQWGITSAFETDDTEERRQILKRRGQLVVDILKDHDIDCVPAAGGMFLFLDVSPTGLTGEEFARDLLERERVAVVPGNGFGQVPQFLPDGRVEFTPCELARRAVRICFGRGEECLVEGMKRLARFFRKHCTIGAQT
jgi:aspartate aminotransferase